MSTHWQVELNCKRPVDLAFAFRLAATSVAPPIQLINELYLFDALLYLQCLPKLLFLLLKKLFLLRL